MCCHHQYITAGYRETKSKVPVGLQPPQAAPTRLTWMSCTSQPPVLLQLGQPLSPSQVSVPVHQGRYVSSQWDRPVLRASAAGRVGGRPVHTAPGSALCLIHPCSWLAQTPVAPFCPDVVGIPSPHVHRWPMGRRSHSEHNPAGALGRALLLSPGYQHPP